MSDFDIVRNHYNDSPEFDAALDRIEAEVERLRAEDKKWESAAADAVKYGADLVAEVERLRAIETAARVAVTSWDADGVIFPSQVDSIRAALAKEET